MQTVLPLLLCLISTCESFAPFYSPRTSDLDLRLPPASRFGLRTTHLHVHATDTIPSSPSDLFYYSNQTTSTVWNGPATTTSSSGHFVPQQDATQQQQQLDLLVVPQMPDKATSRWLLLVAAALYGTNFACVKLLGGTELSMGLSSTLRFGLAALCTSPWLFTTTQKNKGGNTASFWAGFEVGIWTSIGYIAQAVGLETTLASESAFLCSLAVVVVPLLDWMTGKQLKTREMVGAVLALVGVGLLELGEAGFTLSRGDLISMIQPLAFGVGFWRMEAAMRKFPNQANRSTAAQLLAVFLASGLYTFVAEGSSLDMNNLGTVLNDPVLWLGLLWTGCITTGLSVYMETVALQTLSAAETTLILSTEPLWGSVTAAVLLGESFGPTAMAGGALVIMACVWSNLGADGLQKFMEKHLS